jgi:hypothetical protein
LIYLFYCIHFLSLYGLIGTAFATDFLFAQSAAFSANREGNYTAYVRDPTQCRMFHSGCAVHLNQTSIEHGRFNDPFIAASCARLEEIPARINNSPQLAPFPGPCPAALKERFFTHCSILHHLLKNRTQYRVCFASNMPFLVSELSHFALTLEPQHALTLSMETNRCSLPSVFILLLQTFYFFYLIHTHRVALGIPTPWQQVQRRVQPHLTNLTLLSQNRGVLALGLYFLLPRVEVYLRRAAWEDGGGCWGWSDSSGCLVNVPLGKEHGLLLLQPSHPRRLRSRVPRPTAALPSRPGGVT